MSGKVTRVEEGKYLLEFTEEEEWQIEQRCKLVGFNTKEDLIADVVKLFVFAPRGLC